MPHDWSEDQVLHLIEPIREHSNIWNPENEAYKNKSKRTDAFNIIATVLELSREKIERKWKVLQTQFRRECAKSVTKSGQGTNELYVSRWFGYKHLMFLKDKNTPKHTRDTQEQDSENTQYEDSSDTILTEGSSSILQLQQAETPHDIVKQLATIRKESSGKQLNPSDPHDIGIESEPSQRDTVRQLVPAGKKTSGKRPNMSDPQMDEAFKTIKTLTENRKVRDSFEVYGEYVANKLRTYDAFVRADVEHKIKCVLHDADMRILYNSHGQFTPRTTNLPIPTVSPVSSSLSYAPASSPYYTSRSTSIQHPSDQDSPNEHSFIDALTGFQADNSTDIS